MTVPGDPISKKHSIFTENTGAGRKKGC